MNFAGMNIIDVAPYFGAVLIGVTLVGWLLALFLRVFLAILGPKFTGAGCLTSLTTLLAAIIAGAGTIGGAIIASGAIPLAEILGIPAQPSAPIQPFVKPPAGVQALPPIVIILLAILLFVATFLVIRRTLRTSVT